MKIGFAIGKVSGDELNSDLKLVNVVYDFADIRKAVENGFSGHEYVFFNYIQALSRNTLFSEAILKARKELKLPKNGLPFRQYCDFSHFFTKNFKRNRAMVTRYLDIQDRIGSGFSNPWYSTKHLFDIIFYNLVSPFSAEQAAIRWWAHLPEPLESVDINIFEPMTKNAVMGFIENNWKHIEASMGLLTKKPTTGFKEISDRGLKIVALKDELNLTYAEITEVLDKNSLHSSTNQTSVKMHYYRAKKKIAAIYKPKQ